MSMCSPERSQCELRSSESGVTTDAFRIPFDANAAYKASVHGYDDDLKDILILCDALTKSQMLEWTDEYGRTALVVATQLGNYKCIKILLEAGANVNHMCTHRSGGTALHLAVFLDRSKKIVHQLLLHGAQAHDPCSFGMLHVSAGADPFVENFGGVTPWDVSLSNGNSSNVMFSSFALFEAQLYVKGFNPSATPRPFCVRIIPRHSCAGIDSGKRIVGMRLYIHRRGHTKAVSEIDLDGCSATISIEDDGGLSDVLLTCPSTCLLSCSEKSVGKLSNGRTAALWLRGKRELLAGLIDIVNDQDLSQNDDSTDEDASDEDHEDPSSSLWSRTDDLFAESSISDGSSLSPSSMACTPEGRWPRGLGGTEPLAFFKPRHGTTAKRCDHGRVVVKEGGVGRHSDDDGSTNEGHLCVMCLDRPKTVGFVHGNSMHVCSCEECAEKVSKRSNRCPLCREIIQHIVTKIF